MSTEPQNLPKQFKESFLTSLYKPQLVSIIKEISFILQANICSVGFKQDLVRSLHTFLKNLFISGTNPDLVINIINAEVSKAAASRRQPTAPSFSRLTAMNFQQAPYSRTPTTNGNMGANILATNKNIDPRLMKNLAFAPRHHIMPMPALSSTAYHKSPHMLSPEVNDNRFNATHLERFNKSIFYQIVLQFMPYKICPASYVQTSAIIELTLSEKDIDFLKSPRLDTLEPGIKLFCVPVRDIEALIPNDANRVHIKFPETCELRINGKTLQVNLRGKKQRPGTTRAPDIHSHIAISKNATNRVELVYLKTTEPFLLVAQAVLTSPIPMLLDKIVATKSIPAETVKKTLFASGEEDDIVATIELSLKCPLGFVRIDHPFRSIHCTHPQCFDGSIFLQMNEQMETWECPVCQRIIDPFNDLIRDEFFLSILESTSAEVESVLMESDGSWRLKGEQPCTIKRSASPEFDSNVIELSDSPVQEQQSQPVNDIVDLTLSDDEHEPPQTSHSQLVCVPAPPSVYEPSLSHPMLLPTKPFSSLSPPPMPAIMPEGDLLLPPPSYQPTRHRQPEELLTLPPPSFLNQDD
ncbi:E3 SUMO-protein ligase pli1 [Entomophthora muscae]|uniref:E3 SUMO-protein ligase pli1 n=1 Tax=Entomophthora muscae TaxID=34485 RepID=A0ACC2UG77_9FUNG|nr:E3 SUMO-protein ligase pli1 [Entomophthora muscae]